MFDTIATQKRSRSGGVASARHLGDRPASSHKTEFSFLNGIFIGAGVSAAYLSLRDLQNGGGENVWRIIIKTLMEVLLFLAIVSLTLISTIDLFMQTVKQENNTHKKY